MLSFYRIKAKQIKFEIEKWCENITDIAFSFMFFYVYDTFVKFQSSRRKVDT